jgi:hypothetical protein
MGEDARGLPGRPARTRPYGAGEGGHGPGAIGVSGQMAFPRGQLNSPGGDAAAIAATRGDFDSWTCVAGGH